MGKDTTDNILHESPNTKNDKKKFIEDKENSIQSKNSKAPPKFSLKVRSDLTAEVLEDENTNDSINSSNSKSNKSAASSSSKLEAKHNSSSTSSNVKSPNAINVENPEEENTTPFRIASNNPTGFKLRIVPLEKLLEKPPPQKKEATPPVKGPKNENAPVGRTRRLPQRRSKPVSFIELSDSEEEEEEEEDSRSSLLGSKTKINKRGEAPLKHTTKGTINISDSEEEEPKKFDKKASDSDEEDSRKTKSSNKNSALKTIETEEPRSPNLNSKRESVKYTSSVSEDFPKKNKQKNNYSCISSGSEEETVKSTRTQVTKRSKTNNKLEEKLETDKDESNKSVDNSKKNLRSRENKTLQKSASVDKSANKKAESKKSNRNKYLSSKENSDSEGNEGSSIKSDSALADTEDSKNKKKSTAEDTSSGSEFTTKKSKPKNNKFSDSSSDADDDETDKRNKVQIKKKKRVNPRLENLNSDSYESVESSGSEGKDKQNLYKLKKNLRDTGDNTLKNSTSSYKPANNKPESSKENQKKHISPKDTSESEENEEDGKSSIKLKVTSDSESINSTNLNKKNKLTVKESTGAKGEPKKNQLKRKYSSKDSSEKENSETEQVKARKSALKRKRVEISLPSAANKADTSRSSKSDLEEFEKEKSKPKSKETTKLVTPPSPSTVRRFVVRVKRSKLSDFKDISKNKTKGNMNGRGKSEKPSTSRRKQDSSDEDSDFDFRRAAIAEHDYDGHDADDNDDDEKASQKSSDSEIIPTRKRRVFRKEKKTSENSDSDFEPKQKDKKKKRRVRRHSSDDSSDDKKKTNRKDIRKIIKSDDLNLSTKEAAKQEQDRRKRIEERQKLYNQIYEKPESVEVSELVLDFDTEDGSTLLEVDKGLMKKLKPHQVTGIKFMWDACFETLNDAQEKSGSGCILAHCMGLGKTMQIVALSHTLLVNSRKTHVERVLIISPLSTLNNWAREFKHWISFTKKRNIEIFDMSKYKDKQTRIFKLNEWFEEGGVCILGYDMYRILANEKAKGLKKKQREILQKTLVDPGADLVVCDEGHLLKNEKTSISKAVTRMRTQRRIVLTGTPLQNNLKEYYCMIQFIKPNLLGTYKEYLNRFVNPISNGQYTDSTDRDIRLMKHRSHILHKLLEGCIQRRDYSVLAPYLPPKHEYVVYTTLSILQQLLYEHYMVHQRDLYSNSAEGKGAKLFQDFQELRRIWTHPMNMRINSDSVIRKKILANESDSMDDFICDDEKDEDGADSSSDSTIDSSKSFSSQGGAAPPSKVVKTRNFSRKVAEEGLEVESDIEEIPTQQKDDPSEWWKRFVADKELNNINHSPKLVILMRLLEQCEAIGDKLLVFSQSLQSLDTIEHFLSLIDNKTRGYEYEGDVGDLKGLWKPGTDYFRLDGSCSVELRESMCKRFNDVSNLRARLFLISTRAGGLGINLVSANRVVIFDVSWNPSHDTQSIFRVYRFGQIKPCYIYRLIAMGTMEQKLYERQVAKQATAKRVIDEQQISRHYNQSDLQELYTYELQPPVPREIPILPKDRLFAELLTEHESLLFKYHEHDSLLENEESENLSAEERKAAWSEYEAEKTRAVQTAQYVAYDRSAYGQFGNAAGSVTSNKIFGFRSDILLQLLNMKVAKDHPEMTQNQVIQVVPTYLNQLYSEMNSGNPQMYKDLLSLHGTLTHPSGMYMNPLLYVNQDPSAAGYFQAGAQPPANGVGGPPVMVGGPPPVMLPGGPPMMGIPMGVALQPAPPVAAPGFDPNEVYEID